VVRLATHLLPPSTRRAPRREPSCGSSLMGGPQESRAAARGLQGALPSPVLGRQSWSRDRGAPRQQQSGEEQRLPRPPATPGFRSKRQTVLHTPKISPVKISKIPKGSPGLLGWGGGRGTVLSLFCHHLSSCHKFWLTSSCKHTSPGSNAGR